MFGAFLKHIFDIIKQILDKFGTGISGQEGRIYDCSPPANISKFEFSRDVFF